MMNERAWLADRFAEHRPRLRAVAYRMLGSFTEAEDALQEAWLRCSRADVSAVENVAGWLTTVTARVCLNLLRAREHRREEPLLPHQADPVLSPLSGPDPEQQALLADAVGLALLVVLDSLVPAERVAFVLHDLFGVPFEEIAPLLERTPAAARQLASRARRRVRDQAPAPDPDLGRQRAVVDAFFAAARDGDLAALVAVLDPGVVLRADGGARPSVVLRGREEVAGQALTGPRFARWVRPVLVNGAAGVVAVHQGRPLSVMAFTVTGGKIVAIDVLMDPERLAALDLSAVGVSTVDG